MSSPEQRDREASLAQFRAFTGGPVGGAVRERAERALGVGSDEESSTTRSSGASTSQTASGGSGNLSRRAS